MPFVASSCSSSDETPGQFFTLKNARWPYGQVLTFNEAKDSVNAGVEEAHISVRHTSNYSYANLWVELSYNSADSTVADTFNVLLSDSYGKWLGSGSGPVVTRVDTLRLRHTPDIATSFKLRHIMRVDTLENIEEVGMSFVPLHHHN